MRQMIFRQMQLKSGRCFIHTDPGHPDSRRIFVDYAVPRGHAPVYTRREVQASDWTDGRLRYIDGFLVLYEFQALTCTR